MKLKFTLIVCAICAWAATGVARAESVLPAEPGSRFDAPQVFLNLQHSLLGPFGIVGASLGIDFNRWAAVEVGGGLHLGTNEPRAATAGLITLRPIVGRTLALTLSTGLSYRAVDGDAYCFTCDYDEQKATRTLFVPVQVGLTYETSTGVQVRPALGFRVAAHSFDCQPSADRPCSSPLLPATPYLAIAVGWSIAR